MFVLVMATVLVCLGAGPAFADDDPDSADATSSAADIPDIDEPTDTDIALGGNANERETSDEATTESQTWPVSDATAASPTPAQDPADASLDPIQSDAGTGVVVPAADGSDTDVVDADGGGSTSNDDDATVGEDSGGDNGTGEDAGGIDVDEGSSTDPPLDIEETSDKETTEPEPAPSDEEEATDTANSADDTADTGDAEPAEDASDLDEVDIVGTGDAEAIETETSDNATVEPIEDETKSPKKEPVTEPSSGPGSWDPMTHGLPGVKSDHSNGDWSDVETGDDASLSELVGGGNHIHGTASIELVAAETERERKNSAPSVGRAFSMPFSSGFGMPLTGFDILVMSVMGLSLILVGVILFARGIERQSAVRRSTKKRKAAGAPPPSSVAEPDQRLLSRIRGVKRKRVV